MAGKQRMYSQKLIKIAHDNLTDNSLNELEKNLTEFSNAHTNLKDNFLEKFDDDSLNELYKALEPKFLALQLNVKNIINKKGDLEENKKRVKINADKFLPIMDTIVTQYVTIGKDTGASIINHEITFNIFLICFIFYSVFTTMYAYIEEEKDEKKES